MLNTPVSNNSRPVIRQPIELATHVGLKTYNRTFGRVEAALFLAEVVAHLQGRASDAYAAEITQVNAAIARELDRLMGLVTGQARWVEQLLKKNPPAGPVDAVGYTQPACVELTMRTPQVRRYAGLLADLERTLRAIDAAWYAGALNTIAQLQGGNLLFRHFQRSCGVIERLARGLARRVRDEGEAPGYRDMLVKRTGQGPALAEAAPAMADEGAGTMTAGEAESLQATEALVADLSAPDHPLAPPAVEPEAGEPGAGEEGAATGPVEGPTPASAPEGVEPVEPVEPERAGDPSAGDAAAAAPSAALAPAEDDPPAEPPAPEAPSSTRRRLREVLGSARAA